MKELNIAWNKLKDLPKSFAQLTELNTISVYENPFDSLAYISSLFPWLDIEFFFYLKTDIAIAYFNRAKEFHNQGKLTKAIFWYTKSIEADPKMVHAYQNRGIIFHIMNDVQAAIKDYSEVLKLNPKIETIYLDRGNLYISSGEKDKACFDWTQAAKLGNKQATELIKNFCKK
ncbi:MAG: hypothetical protein K8S00_12505 [Bacteroidales bacterium]|nr:hypothetical protein [Bacteroidales bacterium]